MDQAEEIRKMIESASDGYWIPLGIVCFSFGIVISLLLYIWNQMLKQNEARHQEHEKRDQHHDEMLEKVTDNLQQLKLLFVEISTEHKMAKK